MVYRIVTAAQMHIAEGDAVVLQWALRILYFLALHADGSCAALTYALPLGEAYMHVCVCLSVCVRRPAVQAGGERLLRAARSGSARAPYPDAGGGLGGQMHTRPRRVGQSCPTLPYPSASLF